MSKEDHNSVDYLDPKVLTKISSLELRARLVVEGFFAGMHHSPHHGVSSEFADHRAYTQGDDLRHIDWKIFGRTDKYYIKEYEQESNLNLFVIMDGSESMAYRSSDETLSKYDYASTAAAAMAYLALQQHDMVGLAVFDEGIRRFLKPSNSTLHWKTIARELGQHTGKAKTSIGQVLDEVADRLNQRSVVVLISDLLDDVDNIAKGLQRLRFQGHEPIVWCVWDLAELTFPFRDATMFEGLEATGSLLIDPGSLRDRYIEEVHRFQSKFRTVCGRTKTDFVQYDTSESLGVALSNYLAARAVRLRTRFSRVMR